MSFFEELPDPPPMLQQRQPAWIGPPGNELPVSVPLELLVGRSERAAVLLGSVRAYSTGVELEVTMLVREQPVQMFFNPLHLHPGQDKATILRFAIVCADGSRAESERGFPGDPEAEPARVLTPTGGGGGGGRWQHGLWLWPLPPPGPIEAVCAWPALGIPETRARFDAGPILEAAGKVERLWPENADPGGGGSIVVTEMRATASSDDD